jgi:hypothetical protein
MSIPNSESIFCACLCLAAVRASGARMPVRPVPPFLGSPLANSGVAGRAWTLSAALPRTADLSDLSLDVAWASPSNTKTISLSLPTRLSNSANYPRFNDYHERHCSCLFIVAVLISLCGCLFPDFFLLHEILCDIPKSRVLQPPSV